jgi:hypothetical protein
MLRWRTIAIVVFSAMLLAWMSPMAFAQAGGGGGGAGGGGGGGGGRGGRGGGGRGFDPVAAQAARDQALKEALGVTDDEWTKVLQPKIQKVQTAQTTVTTGQMAGRFGMFGRGRGGGGGGGTAAAGGGGGRGGAFGADNPIVKALTDLRAALDDKNTPAEDIAKKLKTLRDARDQAHEELVKAQKELQGVLTQRQEATLVTMGMLD